MLYEFCAENFTRVSDAIAHGAGRVELCDNLARGGTSPSIGVLNHTLAYVHAHGATVMTMVRPRGGDFVYSEDELAIMVEDASVVAERGTDGIVLGCLRGEPGRYRVDEAATERVILAAQRAAGAHARGHLPHGLRRAGRGSAGRHAPAARLAWRDPRAHAWRPCGHADTGQRCPHKASCRGGARRPQDSSRWRYHVAEPGCGGHRHRRVRTPWHEDRAAWG